MPTRETGTGYALTLFGSTLPLAERTLIGRDRGCDVSVAGDPLVSRRHARLVVCAHGVVIEDLSSTNGVYVDGDRVPDGRLLVGWESIRLGSTDLILSCVSLERKDARLDWDDVTVNMKQPSTSSDTRRAVSETDAGIFEVLSSLAQKALLVGDSELAERIVGARRVDRRLLASYLRAVATSTDRLAPKDQLRLCRVENLARMRQTG